MHAAAQTALQHVRSLSTGPPVDRRWRVTLTFHPDAEVRGESVLSRMVRDDRYRSQFETGTSNGGLTAHPGGPRWAWEQRIFGGAYDDAPPGRRPVYGALDHRGDPLGGAPRFGSAYLRLREEVLDRSTFCFPDSVLEPRSFGTADSIDLVAAADAFRAAPRDDALERAEGGLLDAYVEAHVQGGVVLSRDVEALVLDPSHREGPVGALAQRLTLPVEWHEGRVLHVDELRRHPDFRGIEAVRLGELIAEDDVLTARVVGERRRQGRDDPQRLKELWHLVARFGSPAG